MHSDGTGQSGEPDVTALMPSGYALHDQAREIEALHKRVAQLERELECARELANARGEWIIYRGRRQRREGVALR